MEPVDRTNEGLRGLISDLDGKLGRLPGPSVEPETGPGVFARARPWALVFALTLVVAGMALLAGQPWQEGCTYSRELCSVQQLDIDALRVTIPNSELITQLPNIDAIDPNDELTTGDILSMERFADMDIEKLISSDELELLLRFME